MQGGNDRNNEDDDGEDDDDDDDFAALDCLPQMPARLSGAGIDRNPFPER